MTPLTQRLAGRLQGPYPVLPRPVDALAERWARLPPRLRLLVACAAVVVAVAGVQARVRQADARWGGPPVEVLVATADLPVGARPEVRRVAFPPVVVPSRAVSRLPEGAMLTLALPDGAVLTEAHLDPSGPAVGLGHDLRAVPVPVEDGWGVAAGGWVDVWVLGAGEDPARQVARRRPVLEIRRDETGQTTALVGLGEEEVAEATAGLALGRVLLTHVPRPSAADGDG